MDVKDLRGLVEAELHEKRQQLKQELFNLRFQLATGQLDNSSAIKKVRHEIARIATVIRQRDIEVRKTAAETEAPGTEPRVGSEG